MKITISDKGDHHEIACDSPVRGSYRELTMPDGSKMGLSCFMDCGNCGLMWPADEEPPVIPGGCTHNFGDHCRFDYGPENYPNSKFVKAWKRLRELMEAAEMTDDEEAVKAIATAIYPSDPEEYTAAAKRVLLALRELGWLSADEVSAKIADAYGDGVAAGA